MLCFNKHMQTLLYDCVLSLSQYKTVVHMSLPCSVCRSHRSRSPRRELTYGVRVLACCPVYRSHRTSTNTLLYFTRRYHVQYVVHIDHVFHEPCPVCRCPVCRSHRCYVNTKIVVCASLPCPVCRSHRNFSNK